MAKNLTQHVTFNANPRTIYNYFVNSKQHSRFTGRRANIQNRVGAKFHAYNGTIEGFMLNTQPGKKIVQAWRQKSWPKGVYSIVTYIFKKEKGNKTKMILTQAGIPDEKVKTLRFGWQKNYWQPLKETLRNQRRAA